MIKFTQLTDKLMYPSKFKATLSILHSDIVDYVTHHFKNTTKFKSQVVSVLNTVTYYVLSGDTLPSDWKSTDPLSNLECVDSALCETKLGDLYLHAKNIKWDVEESLDSPITCTAETKLPEVTKPATKVECSSNYMVSPTPKEHLYIKPPAVPQLDTSKPWLQTQVNQNLYVIYRSLPLIPLNQSQISVTTDVSTMTSGDLLKLYPNCFIRTRASVMYEAYGDLTLDPDVGIILPISGFSPSQVRENIIKYPHIYKLIRCVNGAYKSFYSNIELNGELHDTLEVWDTLPDSAKMPRNSDYIKEYVVRRYLLERDIKGVAHHYPLYGDLNPFLTLFTTVDDYIRLGFTDVVDLAKQCVISRVNYKRSRNPILKVVYNQ